MSKPGYVRVYDCYFCTSIVIQLLKFKRLEYNNIHVRTHSFIYSTLRQNGNIIIIVTCEIKWHIIFRLCFNIIYVFAIRACMSSFRIVVKGWGPVRKYLYCKIRVRALWTHCSAYRGCYLFIIADLRNNVIQCARIYCRNFFSHFIAQQARRVHNNNRIKRSICITYH